MWNTCGYNAFFLPWTGFGYPANLSPAAGQPELSFEEFCTRLEAAGVGRLRVNLSGWNHAQNRDVQSFEPTLGTFNPWGGRLEEMVDACARHNVGMQVLPFENVEFLRGWYYHAWNARNGGPYTDPRLVFSEQRAIDAARARIDAIVATCGDVIESWEVMSEMSWMIEQEFWQKNDWDFRDIVRGILCPWVSTIAQHIQARHPAPVGNGNVFAPNGFPDDPNALARVRNEIYQVPELDFATTNWYGVRSVADKVAFLRECQRVIGKPIYIEQYAPWIANPTAPYEREPEDFSWSKAHEWAAICGEFGAVGAARWPEHKPQGEYAQWWGIAHPNMAEIAGTVSAFARAVDLDGWMGRGEAWDGRVSSENLSLVSAWGNGEHLTAFLKWLDIGAHNVTIGGLLDGAYTARFFDWIEGDEVAERDAWCEDGQVVLETVPVRETATVLYLAPKPSTPPLETRTMHVVLTEKRGDQVLSVWEGELAERVL